MEVEAAAADHHAAAAGARAAGREDLHRQGTHGRVGDFEVRFENSLMSEIILRSARKFHNLLAIEI